MHIVTSSFDPVRYAMPADAVRGTYLADRVSLAVAWALRACPLSREDVAQRISVSLGQVVSVHMLSGYASQARQDHRITLERFMALVEATGMHQLLGFVCAPFDVAAVPDAHVELIELQLIEDRLRALEARKRAVLAERRAVS